MQGDQQAIPEEEIARLLVDGVEALIAYWDRDRRYRFANRSHQEWFGRDASGLSGVALRDVLGDALYAWIMPFLDATYRGERQEFEADFTLPDGSIRRALLHFLPHVHEGRVMGILAQAVNIDRLARQLIELRQAKDRIEELARRDPLTHAYNRSWMESAMLRLLAQGPAGARLALLVVDVDNFKQINDRHGHRCGDHVLIEIARRLAKQVRIDDPVFRMGGDEFAIMSPLSSESDLENLAQRLIRAMQVPMTWEGLELVATVTIGAAIRRTHAVVLDAWIEEADRALYRAKQAGKNQWAQSPVRNTDSASKEDGASVKN